MNDCQMLVSPQAVQIGVFMVGFIGVMAIVTSLLNVIKFFRPDPALHRQYASRDEVDKLDRKLLATETKLETQIENLNSKITEQYEKIERSDEARTSGLHNRMNTIAESVARLTGQLESSGQLIESLLKREAK